MEGFGYLISQTRGINLDTNDFQLSRHLEQREPSIRQCIGCGGCTATCSAGNLTPFNFRKMHLMVRRGEYKDLQKEVEKCMLCGKCTLVCPRGVNTRNIVIVLRSLL